MQRYSPGNRRAWRANPAIQTGGRSPRQPHLHWTAPWGLEDGSSFSNIPISLKRKKGGKPESCCLSGRFLLTLYQFRHPFRIFRSLANTMHQFSGLFPLVLDSALRLWWKQRKNLLSRFPALSTSHSAPCWLRPKASCTHRLSSRAANVTCS